MSPMHPEAERDGPQECQVVARERGIGGIGNEGVVQADLEESRMPLRVGSLTRLRGRIAPLE